MKLISYAVEDSRKPGDSNKREDGRLRLIRAKQGRCDHHSYDLIQESRLRIIAYNDYSNNNHHNGGGEVGGGNAEAAAAVLEAATKTTV